MRGLQRKGLGRVYIRTVGLGRDAREARAVARGRIHAFGASCLSIGSREKKREKLGELQINTFAV